MLTKDGYDLQFGTNVVGPHLFTELLMPALLAGVKSSSDGHVRVITTSSSTAYVGTIQWDTFKDGPARRKLSSGLHYAQSKLVRPLSFHRAFACIFLTSPSGERHCREADLEALRGQGHHLHFSPSW